MTVTCRLQRLPIHLQHSVVKTRGCPVGYLLWHTTTPRGRVSPPPLLWVLGITLRLPGLYSKSLYVPSQSHRPPQMLSIESSLPCHSIQCFIESLQTFKSKAKQSGFGINVLWAEVEMVLLTQFSYCIQSATIRWHKTQEQRFPFGSSDLGPQSVSTRRE